MTFDLGETAVSSVKESIQTNFKFSLTSARDDQRLQLRHFLKFYI